MILDSVQGLNTVHASLCSFLASKDQVVRLPADVSGSPAPYDELLPALEVEKTEGPVYASILTDRTLKIVGGVENLGVYVGFFQFEDADDGRHHHPEHVARTGYIRRGTLSVIIEADNDYLNGVEGEGYPIGVDRRSEADVQGRPEKYWRLRPETSSADDEVCKCPDDPPIVLQDHLSSNPIGCVICNGEVSPERIGFSAELAEKIVSWRDLHRALFTLELDSSDYESWARDQLKEPGGRVHVLGLAIVEELNRYRRTYYWWFTSTEGEAVPPVANCPRCAAALLQLAGHRVCNTCSILVPHG